VVIGYIFPVLVICTKKNLATLPSRRAVHVIIVEYQPRQILRLSVQDPNDLNPLRTQARIISYVLTGIDQAVIKARLAQLNLDSGGSHDSVLNFECKM
jgi:hypothetical protein